jgi:hypothetical protein
MGNETDQETRIEDESRRGDVVAFHAAMVRIYVVAFPPPLYLSLTPHCSLGVGTGERPRAGAPRFKAFELTPYT